MDWPTIIKILHVIGTALGVGGATFAELLYAKASEDSRIDESEGKLLAVVFHALRIGTILLVLSGFMYLVYYRLHGTPQQLYSPRLWIKLTVTFIILMNAVLMQLRRIPLWLGSAISLVSWYTALVLGAWRKLSWSYLEILGWYALLLIVVAVIFRLRRHRMGAQRP